MSDKKNGRGAQSRLPGTHMTLGLLLFASTCSHGLPLTERQSLELGLARPELLQLQASRVDQLRGDLSREETWSNPELELSREELGDETESGIWLRQRLDLSGRRTLRIEAARASLRAGQAETASDRLERAAEIRRQFFQTLYHQQQRELLERWVDRFSSLEGAMRKREAAGDVSGYDRLRISREKVSLLARQRESQAAYQSAWLQLSGLLGLTQRQGFDRLRGELLPGVQAPLEEVLTVLPGQPALLRLQHQAQARRSSSAALARAGVPDLQLGLGHKRLEVGGGGESGMMLSAAVSLPLFDRRQGERRRVQAELRELESEYQLSRSRLEAEARSLWQLSGDLADNARLFREQSVAASHELVRIAQTAYNNNELGVLELVDAYRNALEADLNALQLALEARNRRIDLDRLMGEELP